MLRPLVAPTSTYLNQRTRRANEKRIHRFIHQPQVVPPTLSRLFLVAHNIELRIVSLIVRARELADDVVLLDAGSSDETVQLANEIGCQVVRIQDHQGPQALARLLIQEDLVAEHMLLINIDDSLRLTDLSMSVNRSRERWDLHIAYHERSEEGVELDDLVLGTLGLRHVAMSLKGCESLATMPASALVADVPTALRVRFVGVEAPIQLPQRESLATASRFAQLFYWMLESKHPLLLFGIPGLVLFVLGYRLSGDLGTLLQEVNSTSVGVTLVTVAMTLTGLFGMMVALILYIMGKQVERVQHQYNWPKDN